MLTALPSEARKSEDLSFRRTLRKATLMLSLALGVPLLATAIHVLALMRAAERVNHTDRVIAEIYTARTLLRDIETGARDFAYWKDEQTLKPYFAGQPALDESFQTLAELISDNPVQTTRLAAVRQDVAAWRTALQGMVQRAREGAPFASFEEALTHQASLEQVREQLNTMLEAENALQTRRIRALRTTEIGFAVGLFVAAIGLPALVVLMRRWLSEAGSLYRTNSELADRRAEVLRVTLRSIGDAVAATDAEGRVSFLNPTAEKLMGWTTAEVHGRLLEEVFPIFNEETGAPAENPVARVLRERIVVGLANHTVLRSRTGVETPIEDSAAPIMDDHGAVLGVILVFRDVTEKRDADLRVTASERRLRILNELGEATRASVDPHEIMRVSCRLLGEHLKVSRCAYAEVEPDGERFVIVDDYTSGVASSRGNYHLSLFGPRALTAMRGGDTLVIRDMGREISVDEGTSMFRAISIEAIICCPLIKSGRLRAMMAVHQTTPRHWTEEEIAIVREVVERCWSIIERARAENELRDQARFSRLRAEVAGRLAANRPLPAILRECTELLAEHLHALSVRLWMPSSEEDSVLELHADSLGVLSPERPDARIPTARSLIGEVAERKSPRFADLTKESWSDDAALTPPAGATSFAALPLVGEGSTVAVLGLMLRHPAPLTLAKDLEPITDALVQSLERKQAEAARRASEDLKTAIIDTSLDGFILMDHRGVIVEWNAAAERIFGLAHVEAIGRVLGDLIVPARLRESHRKGLERYVETRKPSILGRRYELPAIRADGVEFPCEISINHIPNTEPPLFAGYVRDISERQQAERDLRAAKEQAEASAREVTEFADRFRLLAGVVSLQVWTAGLDGMLDYVNQQCIQYLGPEENEMKFLGDSWPQFVHPDDLQEAMERWQFSLRTGERYEVEFRLRRFDREYRWFLARAEVMRDGDGKMVKWFGTNTDIHDLKLAQRNAERANRAKDDFLAALSHELRTPLTPVLMTAAALREDEQLPAYARDQLGMIERNTALEARLIDDLLDLTRISRGKLQMRTQLCDTHSLIGLASEIVREEALSKSITIEHDLRAQSSGLTADPARFQQVIWNLLRNAVKFTPTGGHVAIRTRDERNADGEPRLTIEVADTGIGMTPTTLERIFLPFEQGPTGNDHRFGGLGLGLAIARAIVDLHGGEIRAASAGEGRGSIFTVTFPGAASPPSGMVEHQQDPETPLPAPAEDAAVQRLSILLVEDHEPTLQVLQRLLQRAGHQVRAVRSTGEARAAVAEEMVDLVISDLGLPDGTGAELMSYLKSKYRLRGIALSGYGMEEDTLRSRDAGFDAHLVKPVDFHQLERTLRDVIARPLPREA